jgi:phosphatidylglycerol---prolipoprotein diacylglyceryl transferase
MTIQAKKKFDIYKFLLTLPGVLIAFAILFGAFFTIKTISPNGNEPVLLRLGGLTFNWYGVLITIGVLWAMYIAMYLAERRGEDPDRAWVILPILLISGIAGARLWYVVNTWDTYKDNLFSIGAINPGALEVWRGGIAVQGAVVGGAIGLLIYKLFTGIKFLRWADFILTGMIVAQAIGRWGNFFNNEAYGRPTGWFWGIKIPCGYRTSGTIPGSENTACSLPGFGQEVLFHPTFFYESVWDYIVFVILLFAIMYPKKIEKLTKIRLRDGDIMCGYFVLYSTGRFVIESFRTDALYIIGSPATGGIRSAQLLSLIFIIIGLGFFSFRHATGKTRDEEALSMRVRSRQKAVASPTSKPLAVETDPVFDKINNAPESASAENEETELEPDNETHPTDVQPVPPQPKLEHTETQVLKRGHGTDDGS